MKKETLNPIERPVVFEGGEFYGIREFDCHVVSLYTEETHQGGFFTVIPISSKEYRSEHPTKARVTVTRGKNWTIFDIYSDWGKLSTMEIHNSLSKEIEAAIQSAKEKGLLTE